MSQDDFLDELVKHKTTVSVYLVNGIRLHGTVTAHDKFGLHLGSMQTQFVYKHSISTIVPAKMPDAREPIAAPTVEAADGATPAGTLRRPRKVKL